MSDPKPALGFLGVVQRSSKPRTRGLTVVRDGQYGYHAAEDMCQTIGQYVDFLKIRHFYTMTQPLDWDNIWLRKMRLYESYDIRTFPGGIVFEVAYLRGKVDETLAMLCRMGFTAIEISDNIIELTSQEKALYTKKAVSYGLKVLPEFGKKYASDSFNVEETAREIMLQVEAGATAVTMERNELDLILGPNPKGDGGPEAHKLHELVEKVSLDHIIFEAETTAHQSWLFRTFGPDVSIGPNLAFERIPYMEAERHGLGRESGYWFLTDIVEEQQKSK